MTILYFTGGITIHRYRFGNWSWNRKLNSKIIRARKKGKYPYYLEICVRLSHPHRLALRNLLNHVASAGAKDERIIGRLLVFCA